MQKQEFKKKNEERLRNCWNNFKCSNIQIIGASEGEEEQQEIENLFEKIMEHLPNLANEISPGSSENPKVVPKGAHTKAHHNYFTQDKR